jgi:capsular polysaccharide biosynthesis protein
LSGRAVAAFALAGLVAGVAVALVVTAATDEVYRATALLRAVAPTASAEPGPAAGEAPAATYAEIGDSRGFLAQHAGALAGGRLSPVELAGRLDVRRREGTELVELVARGDTPESARLLADELATTLVAHVEETARQRAARIDAELRPRIDQLSAAIAELESTTGSLRSAATTDRLRALRTERAAFQARLADAAVRSAEERFALVPAAPASAADDPIRPRRELNLFGGVLLGLVAGLGSSLLYRRRDPEQEAEQAGEAAARPEPVGVRLLEPTAGAELVGEVALEARAPGAASLELFVSDGSADWTSIATADGDSARVEWDSSALEPGAYWLCVVARDAAGEPAAGEPVPVTVARPQPSAQYAAAR